MELIRKREACEMLAISMNTLEKLIRDGSLPAYQVSDKATRIDREDVENYLETRRIRARKAEEKEKRAAVQRPRCEYFPGMKVV